MVRSRASTNAGPADARSEAKWLMADSADCTLALCRVEYLASACRLETVERVVSGRHFSSSQT